MLWHLYIYEVNVLLLLWLSLMLYSALITITSRASMMIKVICIPLVFAVAYFSIIGTEKLVGTPNYQDEEIQGKLAGYSVFDRNGHKEIAILLQTSIGPRLYAVPYDPNNEKDLSQAMQKLIQTGVPTIVRKKGDMSFGEDGKPGNGQPRDGKKGNGKSNAAGGASGQSGPLEFYDFTEQYLVPKGQTQ